MDVSIVIVNYNGKDLLKKAIDSIKSSMGKKRKILTEIIVVDNCSTDESNKFLGINYPEVILVKNKQNMGYVGINSAVAKCKGKYMLFLNNDIELEKDCISKMIVVIEKDKMVGMVAPRLVNFFDHSLKSGGTWCSRAFYCGHKVDYNEMEIPYMGVGLIRMDIIRKFGYLFDPDYFIYAEDLDLGLRLRLLGYKTIMANAILYHVHAATTKKIGTNTTFLLERNLLTTFFKVMGTKNLVLLAPYVVLLRFLAITKDILSIAPRNAIARIRAIFWVFRNLNKIMAKRKTLQKLRRKDDDFILEIFSERYLFRKPAIF